jgi:HAD superfamily hydrolase (TIGR01484 family)
MSSAMAENPTALLCFDFDGTLVDPNPDWAATNELIEMLLELRKMGAAWVINTGRSLYHTLDGLAQHGLKPPPDFIIAREGEIYSLSKFNRWVDFGDWNARMAKEHKRFYKSHQRFFKQVKHHLKTNTNAEWISEATEPAGIVSSSVEEMDAICRWLDQERTVFPELGYQRNSIYLRFTHVTVNKGSAFQELGRLLNVDADHRFAIGDSHNDLPLLRKSVATCIACPANAVPEIMTLVHEEGGYRADEPSTKGCIEALNYYFFE